MTIPTGLGLRLGPETADPAGAPDGTRVSRAMANDAMACCGQTGDARYKGETNPVGKLWTKHVTVPMTGETADSWDDGNTVCKDPIWT